MGIIENRGQRTEFSNISGVCVPPRLFFNLIMYKFLVHQCSQYMRDSLYAMFRCEGCYSVALC